MTQLFALLFCTLINFSAYASCKGALNQRELLVDLATTPYKKLDKQAKDFADSILDPNDKAWMTDQVSYLPSGSHHAGACPHMCVGHIETLLKFDPQIQRELDWVRGHYQGEKDFGRVVLIAVQGKLIGSLKGVGDPSFVALRNVVRKNGELVLVRGAVYRLSQEFIKSLPPLEDLESWERINVDHLEVQPIDILANENVWQISLLSDYLLKQAETDGQKTKENRIKIFKYLSNELKKVRERLE